VDETNDADAAPPRILGGAVVDVAASGLDIVLGFEMNDDKRPTIPYDRNPQPLVSRGQFRILLILLFLQVAMNAQNNYAPALTTWVKEKWAQHEAAIAHAADVKKQLAIEQQCLNFIEPPDKVVWEEDPVAAEKLLPGSGYSPIPDTDPNDTGGGGGGGGGGEVRFHRHPCSSTARFQFFPNLSIRPSPCQHLTVA
jgi:hypothetical protein